MLNRPIHCTLIALLALTVGGCGSNIKPGSATQPTSSSQTQKLPVAALTPKDLIAQAQKKKSPEREHLLLQAAQLYSQQGRPDKARNLINELDSEALSESNLASYSEISAQLDLNAGDVDAARRILTNPRLERQLNALEPEQEVRLREARAQLFERTGQLADSVSERINLSAILASNSLNNNNQESLWRTLMAMPLSELQTHAAQGGGGITQGWYSLAALSKNNTQDLEGQQAQLSQWLKQWRNHPANGNLPKDLSLLQSLISQQPKNIALLLPLDGRLSEAGEAVRDGFFAAYYQALNTPSTTQRQTPVIRQYDTSKGAVAAYQQALAEGADLVIGPLDKEDVNQVSRVGSFSVPVLSLNYLTPSDTGANAPAGFYQFGLAVEDEARQIARQAIQDGHTRAFIVAPKQEVSERSAQAFLDEWKKLGGTLVGRALFTSQEQFSETLRSALLLDESSARMNLLKQQLATKFEFSARRREDIDMVFMAVTPSQGRQVKPTFAFHYAGDIPIYATSTVYSGEADAATNEDLNGVMFTSIPWLFDNNNPEKNAIAQHSKSSAVYSRLHALGADAFHLYARLPQLKQAPQMRLYGATGSLHLLGNGRIEREQIWAQFQNGLAEPRATVVGNDNIQDE
ncbi:MAG TPA: penicillin-binding protein activator [Cellvibrio sp.]|nr:penicillin-binding protein activator [Cellvibrio sp.]